MPTSTNNHLYALVKALSKSEKRYFKMNIDNNEQMIHLFDLINSKKVLSEEAIIAKILPEKKTGNFAVIKNRLYNHILKALNQFHAEKSVVRQVKDRIQNIEILYKKGLYDQCVKIINSTKKIAVTHDLHFDFLEITKWEKKIAVQYNYENVDLEEIIKISEADSHTLSSIRAYQTIWDVKSKLLIRLYSKGKARSNEDLIAFKTIIKTLPSKEKLSLDKETEYLYHHTMAAYHFCILDSKKSYQFIKMNHDLVVNNSDHFEDEPNILLSILTNAIYLSQKLNHPKETDQFITELENLYTKEFEGKELKMRIFTDKSMTKLASLVMRENYSDGLKMIPEIEAGLQQYGSEISSTKLAGIYYSLALIYFGLDDFSKSLRWINKILNEVKINEAEDQYCFAQILHMIIHVELSNDEYIIHAHKSLKRYLTTRKRMDEFEESFLTLITNLVKTGKQSQRNELYANFAKNMKVLKTNPFTQSAFDYFDFESWASNKSSPASMLRQS